MFPTVNKAVGAAAGGVVAIPTASELWLIIEKYTTNFPPLADAIGIAVLGAVIAFFFGYFAPANVPKA